MNILLTGANGYIGLRLLPQLLDAGHTVHLEQPEAFLTLLEAWLTRHHL